MQLNDQALHNYPWTSLISADVNPVPADAIFSQLSGGALNVYMIASKQYGGGLVSLNRPVPLVNGQPLQYLKMLWRVNPTTDAVALNRCFELDAKVTFPAAPSSTTNIQNCYDGSAQLNLAEGGTWQIDNTAYTWTDTPFKPGPLPADTWTPITITYSMDFNAKTMSVISIAQGTASGTVPATLQAVPAQTTNWAMYVNNQPEPLLTAQIQLDCQTPGAYNALYTLDAVWSDSL